MTGRRAASDGVVEIVWNGRRYRRQTLTGHRSHRLYWMATIHPRTLLHRDVYELHHGPIPDGWHIHHMDGNPLNNDPANLTAMDPSAHQVLHAAERPVRSVVCDECGSVYETKKLASNLRWCSAACKERWRRREGLAYVKPKRGPFREARACEWCDAPYVAQRPWSRFCSSVCKQRALRAARRVAS